MKEFGFSAIYSYCISFVHLTSSMIECSISLFANIERWDEKNIWRKNKKAYDEMKKVRNEKEDSAGSSTVQLVLQNEFF
jgi:hypothetical protein